MGNPTLFDRAPRVKWAPDSVASKAAAEYIAPHAETLRARVYAELKARWQYGATADELCICFGMVRNSIAPRITVLKERGAIRNSGKRRAMPGQRVAATVWVTQGGKQP